MFGLSTQVVQEIIDKNLTLVPTDIIFKNVTVLELSINNIQSLVDLEFEDFGDIEELELGDNNISLISPLAFYGLHKIWRLNLSHNALQYLPDLRNLSESLKYLYLEFNQIHVFNSDHLSLSLLEVMKLSYNLLENFNISSQMDNLKTIEIRQNKLSQFPTFQFLLPNVLTLDLNYNKITGNLSCEDLDNIPNLKTLIMVKNKISFAEVCSRELYHIDLADNNLITPPVLHNYMPMLDSFILRRNIYSSIEDSYFNKTPNLRTLDLRHTGLEILPDISTMKHLRNLYVSHNNLVSIEAGEFKGLPEVRNIRLDYNNLEVIPDFQQLAAESQTSLLQVSLSGNNLHCGSELCWLKHFTKR